MMMSVERFERWLRGLDPQLQNPYVIQPRVEGLEQKLADVAIAARVIATEATLAATLVLQTAVAAAAALAQNAAGLAASLAASLALKANIASPTLTGAPQCPIAAFNTSDFQIANTAWVQTELASFVPLPPLALWRTVLQASGSHVAGIGANTFTLGSGTQIVIAGTDSTVPSQTVSIQSADYPGIGSTVPKFRLRVQLFTNSTDTNAKFFFRLYPIDSVGGGPNNNSFTLGAYIPDSEAFVSGPGVASINDLVSAEFDLPADGIYLVGLETGQTLTADSHVVFSAQLQVHNI